MSDVLDPQDIPVYIWDKGQATLTKLEYIPANTPRYLLSSEGLQWTDRAALSFMQ